MICPRAARRPQLAPAEVACDVGTADNRGSGDVVRHAAGKKPGIGVGKISETINMGFKQVLGLLCAASVSVLLAGAASAQDKTIKIGAIFPLSGGAAS